MTHEVEFKVKTIRYGLWTTCCAVAAFFFVAGRAAADVAPASSLSSGAFFEGPASDDALSLLVDVKIRDESLTFIVDTGAERAMTVDTIVGSAYGPPIRPVKVNHKLDGAIYNLPDAQLGRIKIPSGEATAIDMSGARATTGLPVAGVIGWEGLKGRTLVINHEKKVFQLWEGKADFPDPVTTLPIKEASGIPHIASKMGTGEISFAIDTGDDGGISLLPSEFDRLVGEGWIKPSPNEVQVGTVDGVHSVKS